MNEEIRNAAYAYSVFGYNDDAINATLASEFPEASTQEREEAIADGCALARQNLDDLEAAAAEHDLGRGA